MKTIFELFLDALQIDYTHQFASSSNIVVHNTNSKCSAESFYYAVYYKLADVLPGKPWGEHRFYPQ